jgi:hypothetical protein
MDRSVRKAIMDDTVNKGAYRNAFGITTEARTAAIPLRRMGIPQDIAEIVGFLVDFPRCPKGMTNLRNIVLVVQRARRKLYIRRHPQ